ncbi:alcohol dehydrogenase catalytic domain-containing protein [Dyella acidisoli]|uniref:Zinc-binding dehydrogenase n=1 Tax=Dyella acidisoli TaxID=1867834 RepID=A0ABQ5XIZ9_9GAMM|nr:zinc-binding dehydrogenase [Dyella acidisoli]GLQ91638.1 zinc-binding dehydrogenase [Dyella acidisoli]
MKSMIYRRHGEPSEVLVPNESLGIPTPGPGQVLVKVHQRMVHPIDGLMIRGIVPLPIPESGLVPGGDGVGTIAAVGSGVDLSSGFGVGKRVGLFHVHGTWAEHVTVSTEDLILIPDDISDEAASQVMINGITAATLLRETAATWSLGDERAPILVTAAGSSVGRNLIALAKMRGLELITTVRSLPSANVLSAVFPDVPVIDTSASDWKDQARAVYGSAPKVAIDPIGGAMTADLLDVLADRGTLLTYGGLDYSPSMVSSIALTVRGLTLKGVNVRELSSDQRASDLKDIFHVIRANAASFADYRVFPLPDAVKAMASAQETPRRGAVLLSSDG